MTTTRESSKAGQGRAITRGEEGRVRALLRDALNVYPSGINLYWSHDDKRMTSVSIDADGQRYRDLTRDEVAKATRAGIVPGAEGWCWAPAAVATADGPDDDTTARMLGVDIERVRLARERGSKDDQALLARAGFKPGLHGWQWSAATAPPPAWITAAVLAALPGDGTPRDLMGIHNQASIAEYPRCRDKVPAVLAHLVSTGEIEAIEGGAQWRRWGVPEGWAWARMAADNGDMLEHDGDIVADVGDDGRWAAFPATPVRSAIEQHEITRGRAETPAAARQAALRACHERGVFGPRPAPTLTTSTPQGASMGEQVAIAKAIAGAAPTEDRPARLRAALLSVLSQGPVEGLARLLPALDAAMGESPGVARATGAEARQAAREAGVSVDGARWSLPAMAPGWGWVRALTHALYLAPHGSDNAIADSIANVSARDSLWTVTEPGADGKAIERGEGEDDEDAKGQALDAARRAGLFAPRSAPAPAAGEVSSNGGSSVMPVITAKDGSPIVYPAPHGPLDAAVLAILATASPAEIKAHLTAWARTVVTETVAATVEAVEALPEIKAMRSPRVTIEGPTLRVYAEDGRTVAHEERVGSDDTIDPAWAELEARVERADRAAAEARLEAEAAAAARGTLARDYAAERALSESLRMQLEEAETARDDARAALSDLRAALADLAARWAGGAA